MKRLNPQKLAAILISISLLSACGRGVLRDEESIRAARGEGEVAQLLASIPSPESYPDAEIINILKERVEKVSEDGRCKRILHMVFKIIKESGKAYANIEIGFNARTEKATILYAKTITPEGKRIPLKENAVKIVTPYEGYPSYSDYKNLTFSMPGVTIGSIVDYQAVIEEKSSMIQGKFSSSYSFQGYNPTLLCRYKVSVPGKMRLKYHVSNPPKDFEIAPKTVSQKDAKIFLWEYKDVPQILDEEYMPPFREMAFGVMVTTMDSWDEFSRWWRGKIEGKTDPDQAVKEKVADLTKGLSTPHEKVEALFDYVKREIRYVSIGLGKTGYEPERAREVFENKYGDCKDKSTLLISMLRVAGIPAYYVLIPTHSMRNLIEEFPYPFQFNHCIVALEKDGQYQFIDPVAEHYPIHYLPGEDQNRDVFIFKNQEALFARTPLTQPDENGSYDRQKIKIGMDGAIEGEVISLGSGGDEASMRSFLADTTPIKIREGLEKVFSQEYPGGKLLEYTHSDPLNFKEKLTFQLKYYAPEYCKKTGDIMIFKLPDVRPQCPAAGKKNRRYPVVFSTTSFEKKEIEFNIPEGFGLYYLPESIEIVNSFFEFRSSYRREGERVFYEGELRRKAVGMTPEEYSDYYAVCQTLGKTFREEVLFREKK